MAALSICTPPDTRLPAAITPLRAARARAVAHEVHAYGDTTLERLTFILDGAPFAVRTIERAIDDAVALGLLALDVVGAVIHVRGLTRRAKLAVAA